MLPLGSGSPQHRAIDESFSTDDHPELFPRSDSSANQTLPLTTKSELLSLSSSTSSSSMSSASRTSTPLAQTTPATTEPVYLSPLPSGPNTTPAQNVDNPTATMATDDGFSTSKKATTTFYDSQSPEQTGSSDDDSGSVVPVVKPPSHPEESNRSGTGTGTGTGTSDRLGTIDGSGSSGGSSGGSGSGSSSGSGSTTDGSGGNDSGRTTDSSNGSNNGSTGSSEDSTLPSTVSGLPSASGTGSASPSELEGYDPNYDPDARNTDSEDSDSTSATDSGSTPTDTGFFFSPTRTSDADSGYLSATESAISEHYTSSPSISSWPLDSSSIPTGIETDAGSGSVIESSAPNTNTDTSGDSNSGLSTGAKAGMAVGIIAGVLILAGIVFLLWRNRRKTGSLNGFTNSPVVNISPDLHLHGAAATRDIEKNYPNPPKDRTNWDYRTTFASTNPVKRFRQSISRIFTTSPAPNHMPNIASEPSQSQRRSLGATLGWRRSAISARSIISDVGSAGLGSASGSLRRLRTPPPPMPVSPMSIEEEMAMSNRASSLYSSGTANSADSVNVRPPNSHSEADWPVTSDISGVAAPPPVATAAFHTPFKSRFSGRSNFLGGLSDSPGPVQMPLRSHMVRPPANGEKSPTLQRALHVHQNSISGPRADPDKGMGFDFGTANEPSWPL